MKKWIVGLAVLGVGAWFLLKKKPTITEVQAQGAATAQAKDVGQLVVSTEAKTLGQSTIKAETLIKPVIDWRVSVTDYKTYTVSSGTADSKPVLMLMASTVGVIPPKTVIDEYNRKILELAKTAPYTYDNMIKRYLEVGTNSAIAELDMLLRLQEAAADPKVALGQQVWLISGQIGLPPGADVARWWAEHPTGFIDGYVPFDGTKMPPLVYPGLPPMTSPQISRFSYYIVLGFTPDEAFDRVTKEFPELLGAPMVVSGAIPIPIPEIKETFTASVSQLNSIAAEGYSVTSPEYQAAVDYAYDTVAAQTQTGEVVAWSSEQGYYNVSEAEAYTWEEYL